VSDLIALETVGTEFEADIVCGALRDAGIRCMHQATAMGAGTVDGMPGGGPRVVLVRPEDAARARDVLDARPSP
jgi:hypothetical protein